MPTMNNKAVSEVLGSILILAITIALFSTVMVWVLSFPGPTERMFVDLSPSLDVKTGNINITHNGGETLKDGSVFVYVTINGSTTRYNVSDGNVGNEWVVGETWSKGFTITSSDTVSVSVVTKSEVIMDVILQGKQEGKHAPIILFAWCSPKNVPADNATSFKIYASISDVEDDISNVTVNLSKIGLDVQSLYEISKLYQTKSLKVPAETKIDNYTFTINATDSKNNYCEYNVSMRVTTITKTEGPDLSVDSSDISVSNKNPTRGGSISISVIVKNFGGKAAKADLVLYDGNISVCKVSGIMVSSLGESSRVLYYGNISPAGKHNMTVSVENITPEEEPGFTYNNQATFSISVLTKILVVDDDHHANDGSANDTVAFMENALQVSGFDYEVYTVNEEIDTADGPKYDTGAVQMKDFDVVIWMTGYHRVEGGTLTNTIGDQAELKAFLNNGGKLWLISDYLIDDLEPTSSFVTTRLHATSSPPGDNGPLSPIYGNDSSPVSSGMELETTERVNNGGDYIVPDSDAIKMFNDTSGILALTYENNEKDEKIAFFSFEFSTIKSPDDQSELAYKVLMWMGNLTSTQGRDVAVSSQSFTPEKPSFRQTVKITATIRNNGASDEPSVGVLFYIDDVSIGDIQYVFVGAHNSTTVSENWTAEPVGTHTLRVMADPYYEIDETNERNNELRSRIAPTSLYVSYSILVVDDDNSTNNDGLNVNTTSYVTNALNNLSYSYYFYTVEYNESNGDGPSLDNLTKHNLVIWACGNETKNTLRVNDRNNIESYLAQGGFLWLIGQDIVNDLWGTDFLKNTLKVNSSENDTGTPRNIYGFKNDPVTHGIYYATSPLFPDKADRITPTNDSRPIICNASNTGEYHGLRFENSTCKIIFFPFEYGFISGKEVGIGSEFKESIVWEENFEPPDKWTKNPDIDNVWEIGEPPAGITSAHSSPNCTATKLSGNYKDNEDDWLVSPNITLPSEVVSIKLSFWHWYEIEKNYDYGYVKIKPSSGTAWKTIGAYTGNYKNWHKTIIDITDYKGETVNIAFHFKSDVRWSYKGWYVDDVKIVREYLSPGSPLPNKGEKQIEELSLLILTWMGYPEERIELRITDIDVDAPGHPVLGKAYELKARVWNVGYTSTQTMVYFYEDGVIIDAIPTYLPGRTQACPSSALVQTIWRPFYARSEGKLRVIVDRDNDIQEIGAPEKLLENNIAEKKGPIYFFYDDFEEGSGDWESSAMVLSIKGASEKYIAGYTDTNIPYGWGGVSGTTYVTNGTHTSDYHSAPECTIIAQQQTFNAADPDYAAKVNWAGTPCINISNAEKAELRFWHRFDITRAGNGAFLQIAYKNTGGGSVETGTPYWIYARPTKPYNTNHAGYDVPEAYDDDGTYMLYCWGWHGNDGLYRWEQAGLDLTPYIGKAEQYSNGNIKVRFYMLVYKKYSTSSGGWLIDDVEAHVYKGGKDGWQYIEPSHPWFDAYSGDHVFWCGDNTTGYLTGSMDNSLTTSSIDLTTAKDVKLSFWTKFNMNASAGWPPDGFKVMVSDDGGETWREVNIGFGAGRYVSGTRNDAQDSPSGDGKSISGITPDGSPGWVHSDTLTNLEVDLSGWAGSVIKLRFRVITNNGWQYYGGSWHNNGGNAHHYEDGTVGFGGLYIDDVQIIGNSSTGSKKSITEVWETKGDMSLIDNSDIVNHLFRKDAASKKDAVSKTNYNEAMKNLLEENYDSLRQTYQENKISMKKSIEDFMEEFTVYPLKNVSLCSTIYRFKCKGVITF